MISEVKSTSNRILALASFMESCKRIDRATILTSQGFVNLDFQIVELNFRFDESNSTFNFFLLLYKRDMGDSIKCVHPIKRHEISEYGKVYRNISGMKRILFRNYIHKNLNLHKHPQLIDHTDAHDCTLIFTIHGSPTRDDDWTHASHTW